MHTHKPTIQEGIRGQPTAVSALPPSSPPEHGQQLSHSVPSQSLCYAGKRDPLDTERIQRNTHAHGPPSTPASPQATAKRHRRPSIDADEYFLVASLLTPVDTPCIPQYAAAGYVKLERKFILDRFVPPGLMQRIMAKTFFQFGTDPTAKHNPSPSAKNCWKNAFFQSFQSDVFSVIDIWVWLQAGKGLGGEIRIAGFGNIFVSQQVLAYMDRYSSAITEILSTFPGLCCVTEVALCPVCTMHQRAEEQCGIFTAREIQRLREDLRNLEVTAGVGGGATPRRKRAVSVGSDGMSDISMCMDEPLMSWRHLRARCSANGCNVSADLLTRIPPELMTKRGIVERSEQTIAFLMEEIVRLSAVPSASVKHCICKVGIGYTLTSNVDQFKEDLRSGRMFGPNASGDGGSRHLYTKICTVRASGVLISEPSADAAAMQIPVVISCEHFMTDLEFKNHLPHCPEGAY